MIMGLRDDSFRTSRINETIKFYEKSFIKKMLCNPMQISRDDFNHFETMRPQDLVHTALLVMETKKRVELIYLSQIMTQCSP
jgi:hypothetical protein